jgi:biotin transport system substrate-specific component
VPGPWRGFLATTLYLVVGFAGLQVFAQGASGLGVFAKMSIGYLLAFPLAALLAGLVAERVLRRNRRPRWFWLFAAALTGSILAVHPLGILGMSINGQLALEKALMADMLYWPGDLIKSAIAAAIAVAVHKAFPTLLARPAAAARATREVVVAP